MTLTAEDAVSYGLALVGADVEITNWVAKDAEGNILYNQKDYYQRCRNSTGCLQE